ncbi:MAG TPA: DUF6600 domain-containing protein [Thermoanaerobaculia bacterium]
MKTTRNALFALLLLAAGTVPAASAQVSIGAGIHIGPSGRASVDLGFFYDNLASYGNWIQRPNYGWVWTPADVSTSWRPYEDGHWVWTDQGWTWITDEPYGWATYHYGRWYQDPEIGWAWVPGDEWGPSWVSWQEGDNYVGWAPLPPGVDISASYDSGYGYNGGYGSYDYGIGPDAYVFVPEQYFLAPSIATYVVPQIRVSAFWGRTHNYTHYRREGGRIYNQGVPVDRIQRVIGRSVPRYQIADLQTTDYRQPRARIAGNQVQIFRPQVQRTADVAPPVSRPAARRAVVSAQQFQANHPNRVRSQQVYGSQQGTRWQQRQQQQGAQPGRQVQPYQPRTYQQPQDQYQTRRQRQVNPDNTQQDQYQNGRQGRYNDRQRYQQPQTQDQANPQRPPRAVNPQQDRQRQYDNQQQNPDRGYRPPRAQQQPPPQSQGHHYGENRGPQNDKNQNNGNGNGRQKNQNRERNRDRDRNQDQDNNRPPVR